MRSPCEQCAAQSAAVRRSKTAQRLCRGCFVAAFEAEIHGTIQRTAMFRPGDRVVIGASGGKDSAVLAHVLHTLNERHAYGLQLVLLSVDEGIAGYRDASLEAVRRSQQRSGLPLTVVSYRDLYGWTMDEIVRAIGPRGNCTFCGVFRRQALDRGAQLVGATCVATGHNADDVAETVLLNVLRGDVPRLGRCCAAATQDVADGGLPRCKPLLFAYEKEIVLYAHLQRLDYFATECTYAPNAYRGHARVFLKALEAVRPSAILDVLQSGSHYAARSGSVHLPAPGRCGRCGHVSSNALCKACILLEGLNSGTPR